MHPVHGPVSSEQKPEGEIRPAGHILLHLVAPVLPPRPCDVLNPAVHGVHDDEPSVGEKVPEVQGFRIQLLVVGVVF